LPCPLFQPTRQILSQRRFFSPPNRFRPPLLLPAFPPPSEFLFFLSLSRETFFRNGTLSAERAATAGMTPQISNVHIALPSSANLPKSQTVQLDSLAPFGHNFVEKRRRFERWVR